MFSTFSCHYRENVSTAFTVVKSPRADKVNAGNYNNNNNRLKTRTNAGLVPERSRFIQYTKLKKTNNTAVSAMIKSIVFTGVPSVIVEICGVLLSGLPCPSFSANSLNAEKLNVCKLKD